jgi:hypothetical protein
MEFFQALVDDLQLYGMTETCLSSFLVSVACDGTSVMLGLKSGVAELLKEEFRSVIFWQCANHTLELSAADTVKSVAVFMD